jgi:hypothetical protein
MAAECHIHDATEHESGPTFRYPTAFAECGKHTEEDSHWLERLSDMTFPVYHDGRLYVVVGGGVLTPQQGKARPLDP